MTDDYSALDSLTASDRSFAVYRRPGLEPELMLQFDGLPETFETLTELNGRSGFVMAPFQSTENHPVVLIRPDQIFTGKPQVLNHLQSLTSTQPLHSDQAETKTSTDEGYAVYKGAFDLFQKALHAGSCEKIVLSRTLQLPLPKDFSGMSAATAACFTFIACRVPAMAPPSSSISAA